MLWACLYFPQLPIDRQAATLDAALPTAVVCQHGSRRLIMACNAAAHALGVRAGITLNSAYAMVPELYVNEYDEHQQQAQLQQLALWGLQYSSWVTPREPDSILLEVQASLKLFGGLAQLLDRLHSDAIAQGLTMRTGVAPTPIAARILARAAVAEPATSGKAMLAALAGIPVGMLGLEPFVATSLRQSGISRLEQLMKIPPAPLTRRFGHQCTDLVFKLDGTLPDPCPAFVAPETFSQSIELPMEAPDTQSLSFPLNRLLNSLGGFLRASDLGVKVLNISLSHHRHAATRVQLSFLDATADQTHLFKVARERLANTTLAEPAIRIRVFANELASVERSGRDLLQKSQAQSSSIRQVLDNLSARLGSDKLFIAMPSEDHRPEKAWLAAMFEAQQPPAQWPARPLWLLHEPRPANEPLALETCPERIENGWWGNTDVRRDYYIARNPAGSYFWVFALRQQPSQLYIHGIFA